MKIIPIKDRVVLVRLKKKMTTASGIILERDVEGEADKGQVLAIGPDVTLVQVDDKILIDWNKAGATTINGVPTYVVLEQDIIGVFED
jgi:co-chaperonin GroES (HSP10)